MKTEFNQNAQQARIISGEINEAIFENKPRIEKCVLTFSELEISQCYELLKHNGYKAYFNNGFLTAKKAN